MQEQGKELLTPCKENDRNAIEMTLIYVPRGKLKALVVRKKDIYAVLENAKASVSQEETKKYVDWTEQFWSEGT